MSFGRAGRNLRLPFRVSGDGDMDMEDRRICHVAEAQAYTDAVNVNECMRLIEAHASDCGVLEVEEEGGGDPFYNLHGCRMTGVGDPVKDVDAVSLGHLKATVNALVEDSKARVREEVEVLLEAFKKTESTKCDDKVEGVFEVMKDVVADAKDGPSGYTG